MNLKCCEGQELKSSIIDSESIVGRGGKDNDFMPDLQKISPWKLAAAHQHKRMHHTLPEKFGLPQHKIT